MNFSLLLFNRQINPRVARDQRKKFLSLTNAPSVLVKAAPSRNVNSPSRNTNNLVVGLSNVFRKISAERT